MVSKKRKELRKRTQDEVDKVSSGESFVDSVKNTVFAMAKGSKEERKLDFQEGLTSLGAIVAGGVVGKALSDLQTESLIDEQQGFQTSVISDGDLLRKLEQAEIDAGLSGPDAILKNDMEFGG